jgi:hypothetical protein
MPDDLVTLSIHPDAFHARIEQARLEVFEIPCFLENMHAVGAYLGTAAGLQGVRLRVPCALLGRAREVHALRATPSELEQHGGAARPPDA